jgi:predicted  nucleic acid-binding Zn-ribbon protein
MLQDPLFSIDTIPVKELPPMKTAVSINKMNDMTGVQDDRINFLKTQYENRLKALHEQIAKIYESVSQDEILLAMKENETSSAYVGQRIKEIVEENVAAEREIQIQQLMQDLAFTKSEISKLNAIIQANEEEKHSTQQEMQELLRQKEESERYRAMAEERMKSSEIELGSIRTQFDKIVRSTQMEARELSAHHQENYSVAKRESLLLGQKL